MIEDGQEGNITDTDELPPSKLGTKDYWEDCYEEELTNFAEHGDEGENWFGEGITRKIIDWLCEHLDKQSKILDVGCGNGVVLMRLHGKGFTDLNGIDYSQKAVDLAEAVKVERNCLGVKFSQCDILNEVGEMNATLGGPFDVVLDKGTYDAICLTPDADITELRAKYISTITNMLKTSGHFVITSCNWTRDELLKHFTGINSNFKLNTEIITPSLVFGGQSGNRVTCLIFQSVLI
ncbi:Protein-lysine N-methyltransferase efm4 [Halotydeus destructor]|nr:Protein-lysine N-methyltransferase efm4 [Halotydeus destructor]